MDDTIDDLEDLLQQTTIAARRPGERRGNKIGSHGRGFGRNVDHRGKHRSMRSKKPVTLAPTKKEIEEEEQ